MDLEVISVDNDNYFDDTNYYENDPDNSSYDERYEVASTLNEMLEVDILDLEEPNHDIGVAEAWPTFRYDGQHVNDILIPSNLSWDFGSKILISGSMACGKTSFGIDYANHITTQTKENALYLTSRFSAREQVKKRVSKNVDVRNYHTLIKGHDFWEGKGNGLYFTGRSCLDNYHYIVVDDCHCFFSDSSFILYSDMVLDYLLNKCGHAVVVFLTSCPRIFIDYLYSNNLRISCHYNFISTFPYQHFKCWNHEKDILELLAQLPKDEKALCFCNDKQAEKWENKLVSKYGIQADTIARIESYEYDEDDYISKTNESVQEIISSNQFSAKILFVANTAISYGINIFDDTVMHIIVDKVDPDYAYNVIGRRRITKGGTIPNLYVRQRPLAYHLMKLKKNKGIIELYRNDFKSFFHKNKRKNIDNIIYPLPFSDNNAPIVEYIVNRVAEQAIESNIAYYEYILSQGELSLAKQIGYCLSALSITSFGSYVTSQESQEASIELIAHLEMLLGKKLFEEDIRDIAVILRKVMREQIKRIDKDGINNCFCKKRIPFKLVSDERYRTKVIGEDGKPHSRRYSELERNAQYVMPPTPPILQNSSRTNL